MTSNIYKHIDQEMRFCELCLDMAKRHVEDVLLTLAIVDDQGVPFRDREAVNKEYLQELNQQLGHIFLELDAWKRTQQPSKPDNGSSI